MSFGRVTAGEKQQQQKYSKKEDLLTIKALSCFLAFFCTVDKTFRDENAHCMVEIHVLMLELYNHNPQISVCNRPTLHTDEYLMNTNTS